MNANCKIRRIEFQDIVPFGITLDTFTNIQLTDLMKYDALKKASIRKESVVIASSYQTYPFMNAIELSFDECSIIEIRYSDRNEVPNDNKTIGYIKINHETGSTEKMCKMLLEYSIDKFGIFSVNSLVIKRNSKSPRSINQNTSKAEQPPPVDLLKNDSGKKKGKTHKSSPSNYDVYGPIDFQVNYMMSISSEVLENFRNLETFFIEKEYEETERLNAKNRLEESIYKCRAVISNADQPYISKNDNDDLLNHINKIESWLFDEGEDEEKEIYEEHLKKLESITGSLSSKMDANQNKSNPLEELNCTLKEAEYIVFQSTNSHSKLNDTLNSNIGKLKDNIETCKMTLNDFNSGSSIDEDSIRGQILELKYLVDCIREQFNINLN